MGTIDRIILTIYTFLLILLSLGVIAGSFGLIPQEFLGTSVANIYGQKGVGLAGVVFLLISIRFFLAGLRTRKMNDTIIQHNELGDVYTSLTAVENLVDRSILHLRGVRGVKVKVRYNERGLLINIRAVVSPDCNVPAISQEIQQRVAESIKNTMSVDPADITVLIENISNEFKVRQRVE